MKSYEDKDIGNRVISSGEFPPANKPEDVAQAVWAIYEHARQARTAYEQAMDLNRSFHKGNQLLKIRKTHPNIVDNQTWVAVETVKPRIQKAIRDIAIKAVNENDIDFADALSLRVEYGLKQSYFDELVLPEAIDNMLIEGGAVFKADKSVRVNVIDPKVVFWTPETGFDECWYIGQHHLLTFGEAKRLFGKSLEGKTTELVQKQSETDAPPITTEDAYQALVVSIAPVNQSSPVRRYSSQYFGSSFVKATRLWVIELWVNDQMLDGGELVYPEGRLIQVAVGADDSGAVQKNELEVILDRPNPYSKLFEGTGRWHPFSYAPYENRRGIWSDSLVTKLIPLQRGLNDAWNTWIRNAKLVTSPKVLASEILGLKAGSVTNDAAQVINVPQTYPYPANTALTWSQIPSLAAHFVPIRTSFLQAIREVSGIEDVVRGENPTGVTAGVALNILDSNANQRISASAKSLSLAVSQIKEDMAYIAQELDEGVMMIPDDGIDTDREQVEYNSEMTRDMQLRVVASEKLPLEQVAQVMNVVADLEAKGLPGELVLRYVDDPRLYRIFIEKKREREAMMAVQAQMQQEEEVNEAARQIGAEMLQSQGGGNAVQKP